MPKLNPAGHPNVTHEFFDQMLEKYNIQHFTFEPAPSGIANTTLLVASIDKKLVVRIYPRDGRDLQGIQLELAFMTMLGRSGIPVPHVLRNKDGRQIGPIETGGHDWRYIVMDFVDGQHPGEYTPALLKDLAQTQAKMHILGAAFSPDKNPPKPDNTESVETFNTQIARETISEESVRAFLDRARNFTVSLPASLPSGYNHLDYDADNVLVSGGKIAAVLDFDDLDYSPLVMCLGYTLWDILDDTRDMKQVQAYLAEYQRLRPLSETEPKWLKPVIMFRNYVVGVVDVYFCGNKSKAIKAAMELEHTISEIDQSGFTTEVAPAKRHQSNFAIVGF